MTLSRRDFLKLGATWCYAPLASARLLPRFAWNPDLTAVKQWLSRPSFFTEDLGFSRYLITGQLDAEEYVNKPYVFELRYIFCGMSALATLTKLFYYLKYGIVPNVTAGDICVALEGQKYIDKNGIEARVHDYKYRLYFDGLKSAIENNLQLGNLVNVELLTANWGSRHLEVADIADWPNLFDRAEKACDKGGAIVLFCIKHGAYHMVICTDFKATDGTGETVVLDSWEPSAYKTVLSEWLEPITIDPNHPEVGLQKPLFGMLALTPKFNIIDPEEFCGLINFKACQ